jgi:hypothetical protein
MAKKKGGRGEGVAPAQSADGGADEASAAVAAHSSGEARDGQDGEGQAPPPPSRPQAAWARETSESLAAADEGVRETADGEEESRQGVQAAGGEEGAEERNAQGETTSHSPEPVQQAAATRALPWDTAPPPLSPLAVPSLRLPASESVSARGKGDGAGGSASHRKEEDHPDPVLERAERAMNILDDYILKQSPQKTDPVLERAERGLHMHLNV